MGVKNAMEYYNTANIQIGDIVIIDSTDTQFCEGDRIVEPYTRLRVRRLQIGTLGIAAKLETEQGAIHLDQAENILNFQKQPYIQNADLWITATEAAYRTVQKKAEAANLMFSRMMLIFFLSPFMLLLVTIILNAFEILSDFLLTLMLFGMLALLAYALINIPRSIFTERAEQEKAAHLNKQLQLYLQANPDCTGSMAISGKD